MRRAAVGAVIGLLAVVGVSACGKTNEELIKDTQNKITVEARIAQDQAENFQAEIKQLQAEINTENRALAAIEDALRRQK